MTKICVGLDEMGAAGRADVLRIIRRLFLKKLGKFAWVAVCFGIVGHEITVGGFILAALFAIGGILAAADAVWSMLVDTPLVLDDEHVILVPDFTAKGFSPKSSHVPPASPLPPDLV